MTFVVKDRVRETSTTTGTGSFTLSGAVQGFQSFSVIGDSNTTFYAIVNTQAGQWEVGIGTYTLSTTSLSRDTVLDSSSSGALVNFSAGEKDVFVTYPAEKALYINDVGSAIINNLSLATNQITSIEASDDILITPTGTGALKVQNRITLEDRLSFGPTDPQGSYFANNAEYLQSGFLSAWQYIQNGTATKVEFDNGAAMAISNAPSGNAGDLILGWTEVLNISSAGNFVTGNWTAGIIDSNYGGTGVDNNGNTLTITANATISGTNTGDQTITLTGDVSGSGSGSFATTLANTTVTAGTYGNATQAPQITIDSKGRATSATNVTITPAWASITSTPTTVAGYGITDGVTLTGTQTLTNKTVTDATFSIQDETDNSKKAKFELSGIATATTRTFTLPNVNGTVITDQEYTANDVLTKIKTVDGAGSGLDADLLDGLPLSPQIGINGPVWPSIPFIKDDGVIEVGRYIDFHASSSQGQDYTARLDAGSSTTSRVLGLPTNAGTLISTGGTAVVSNTMLAQITAANKVANSATTATNANTGNAIVARDASGNFTAGTITANLTGLASTSTTLTAGNADLYTNTLPNNTGASPTYIYVGRWTTTQTLEKLSLKILYNNNSATSDSRRTSEYLFYFNTSDGTQFVTGSTGNFYGWGRGLTLGEGGAIDSSNTLAIQTSTAQYDIYIRLINGISAGNGAYVVNISGGSWTHSGTNFGTTAPTGNSYTLYSDTILSNYSDPTFYSLGLLGRLSQDAGWDAADGAGNIQLNNGTGNRIEFIASGVAAPSITTRSVGTKLVLRPAVDATNLDYALGISSSTLWYSTPSTTQFHSFYCGNVAWRIGNAGTSSRGVVYEGNSAFTTQNTGVTLTTANILTLLIQSTPTANITLTLPTGTNMDTNVLASLETYRSFTWSVVNLATGFTVTMAGNTGHTFTGNATVAASSSATFRTQKTATNTFVTYRI